MRSISLSSWVLAVVFGALPAGPACADNEGALLAQPRGPMPAVRTSAPPEGSGLEPIAAPSPALAIAMGDEVGLMERALARPQPPAQLQEGAEWLRSDVAVLHTAGSTRLWGLSVSMWEAPALCHRPLYFEDENLERHGRSLGLLQPAVSAGHFAGRVVAWPYLAGAYPPHECIYTLGRERPGSCAPYSLYRPPVSVHGAAAQAGAVAGLIWVVP
jgi:hypothetical protein